MKPPTEEQLQRYSKYIATFRALSDRAIQQLVNEFGEEESDFAIMSVFATASVEILSFALIARVQAMKDAGESQQECEKQVLGMVELHSQRTLDEWGRALDKIKAAGEAQN